MDQSNSKAKFIEFMMRLLLEMRRWVDEQGLPPVPETTILWDENGTDLRRAPNAYLTYFFFLTDHTNKIYELDGFRDLFELLLSTNAISTTFIDVPDGPIKRNFENSKEWFNNGLIESAAGIAQKFPSFELTNDQWSDVFNGYLQRQGDIKNNRMRLVIPLAKFKSDIVAIEFGSDLRLVPFTNQDRQTSYSSVLNLQFFGIPFGPHSVLANAEFQLIAEWPGEPNVVDINENIKEGIFDILKALRLLDHGVVGIAGMDLQSLATGDRQWISPQEYVSNPVRFGPYYQLSSRDERKLKELFRLLQTENVKKILSQPLRRFNLAYYRETLEDRIIDLAICLESTLLFDESDEFSYRLSLRGALISNLGLTVSQTQQFLRTMYDVRSKIVHAGKTLHDKKIKDKLQKNLDRTPEEFVETCEGIVRDVLKFYVIQVGNGKTMEAINNELDASIIGDLQVGHTSRLTKK